MQYVLHLTNQCNLRCDYCGVPKGEQRMTFDVAQRVCDMALKFALQNSHASACISFYGGEPLLERALIEQVIEYADGISRGSGVEMHYRMTTNGTLLDEAFIRYASLHGIKLALSIDGTQRAHDLHRLDIDGHPSYDRVLCAAQMVLPVLPNTSAMMTVNPDTAPLLMDSVQSLYDLGFCSIVTTPNFCLDWTQQQMDALTDQYRKLADWYADHLLAGERIRLPILDAKLVNHQLPQIDQNKCIPGATRLAIAHDGSIYPCNQFVRHPEFRIGRCGENAPTFVDAISPVLLARVRSEAKQPMPECEQCALRQRCDNQCGCKNLASSGCVNRVSPSICAHERALIPIADHLGERIFA